MFSCFQSCENLLFRAAISSVGSAGTWAMVGDIVAGSLLLRSTACVTPAVSRSSSQHSGDKDWDVFITFRALNYLYVPLTCSWIVFSCEYSLPRFCCHVWKANMIIPIYGSKLSSCLVSLVTENYDFYI